MAEGRNAYEVLPFPRMRRLVLDAGHLSRGRHIMHGLVEADVTDARQYLQRYKTHSGESLSFTAFIIACVGRAVDENKAVHAYRDWRNRLIVFDEVDVLTGIEVELHGQPFPALHPLRAVNRRNVHDIHHEIRSVKAGRERAGQSQSMTAVLVSLPGFLRRILYRGVLLNPHWRRQYAGTVGLTSVGMFAKRGGWALGQPIHTLAITLGGIAAKPGVVDGQIQVREYLNVTVSFDHDIIDGAPAARFTDRLIELIESGYGLTDDTESESL
jgi:pyruvate/2-oxoglutarate dehydrogenase complex dihydrolipoamide acyltransferase (E2) component